MPLDSDGNIAPRGSPAWRPQLYRHPRVGQSFTINLLPCCRYIAPARFPWRTQTNTHPMAYFSAMKRFRALTSTAAGLDPKDVLSAGRRLPGLPLSPVSINAWFCALQILPRQIRFEKKERAVFDPPKKFVQGAGFPQTQWEGPRGTRRFKEDLCAPQSHWRLRRGDDASFEPETSRVHRGCPGNLALPVSQQTRSP